jgi:hypothetical protein
MFNVLLPPGVNPIAVNKYINGNWEENMLNQCPQTFPYGGGRLNWGEKLEWSPDQ